MIKLSSKLWELTNLKFPGKIEVSGDYLVWSRYPYLSKTFVVTNALGRHGDLDHHSGNPWKLLSLKTANWPCKGLPPLQLAHEHVSACIYTRFWCVAIGSLEGGYPMLSNCCNRNYEVLQIYAWLCRIAASHVVCTYRAIEWHNPHNFALILTVRYCSIVKDCINGIGKNQCINNFCQ